MKFDFQSYIDRGKEIIVEKIQGMTRIEFIYSLIIEGFDILSFGMIVRLITGLFYTSFYMFVNFRGISIPPMVIFYPRGFFIKLIIGLSFFSSVRILTPSYMASK
jgi:hypothetical protein